MRRILAFLVAFFFVGAISDPLKGKLSAKIEAIDASFDGVLGVSILDLQSGDTIRLNSAEVFPTASTIKIAVLAAVQREPDPAARSKHAEATRLMIVNSDNAATNLLIEELGFDRINAVFDDLSLKETRLRRKMLDIAAAREGRENTSTPDELVLLLEAIYRGRVCDAECTNEILRVLSLPKPSAIRRAVPASVRVANKPGDLEGVRVDAGIVYAGKRPFAIAVMTTLAADEKAAETAIEEIARAAYSYFERIGRASKYGRFVDP